MGQLDDLKIQVFSLDQKLEKHITNDFKHVAEDVKKMKLVLFADLLLEYFNHAETYLNSK